MNHVRDFEDSDCCGAPELRIIRESCPRLTKALGGTRNASRHHRPARIHSGLSNVPLLGERVLGKTTGRADRNYLDLFPPGLAAPPRR